MYVCMYYYDYYIIITAQTKNCINNTLSFSTNNSKKTPSPVAVSKIDKKLEQYTHALEVGPHSVSFSFNGNFPFIDCERYFGIFLLHLLP